MIVFDILSIDYFHSGKIDSFMNDSGEANEKLFLSVNLQNKFVKWRIFAVIREWNRLIFKGPRRILRCLTLITFNELIRDKSFFVGPTDPNQQ